MTHVVFTLTNWGELALDPALTPHEYCFARAHLARQIEARDVHLVHTMMIIIHSFVTCDRCSCIGNTSAIQSRVHSRAEAKEEIIISLLTL